MAALLLLVTATYAPGLGGGYTFDDYPNIVDNLALRVTQASAASDWIAAILSSPASDLKRPLAMLSFALNHATTGLDPVPMKMTNLAIHLLNTLLVFALVRTLLAFLPTATLRDEARERWVALWVAAAWALNPINLMGVLLVVQRMESLSHTFVFAGLWLYLIGRRRIAQSGNGWGTLLTGLCGGTLLGLLAKESAIQLPLYAFAMECLIFGFRTQGGERDQRITRLFVLTLLLPGLLGMGWLLPKVMTPEAFAMRPFDLGERMLTEGRVVFDYLRWTLLPDLNQLSLYHDDYPISRNLLSPPSTSLALAALAGMTALAWWLRRRRPLVALGIFWFLSAQLLTATVIPLELMFEHRNYFGSLGITLALADLLLLTPKRGRIAIAVGLSLLLFYGSLTYLRAREWSDPIRFSFAEAEKHPDSARATYDLARTLIVLSNYRADSPYVPMAFAALEKARSVPNPNILPDQAAIILASRTKNPVRPDWWISIQTKLAHGPIGPQELGALGALVDCSVQAKCRLPDDAMLTVFSAALTHGPNPEVLNMYGNYSLNTLGDPDLALRLWQDAANQDPTETQYQVNLAKLLIAMGHYDAASLHIASVRQLGHLGQNESVALSLERLVEQSRQGVAR